MQRGLGSGKKLFKTSCRLKIMAGPGSVFSFLAGFFFCGSETNLGTDLEGSKNSPTIVVFCFCGCSLSEGGGPEEYHHCGKCVTFFCSLYLLCCCVKN